MNTNDSTDKTGVLTVDLIDRAADGYEVDWNSYCQIEDDAAGRLVQMVRERRIKNMSELTAVWDSGCAVMNSFPAIHLAGLTNLSPGAAKALALHEGDLYLDGLTKLPLPLAKALADTKGALYLSGITEISDDAAAAMAKHRAGLRLDGLTSLSDAAAAALGDETDGWKRGWLSLKGLTSVSEDAAAALVNGVINLNVSGVKSVSEQTAKILLSGMMVSLGQDAFCGLSVATQIEIGNRKSSHQNLARVRLSGVKDLSESDAELVADYRGMVLFPDLEVLPAEVATTLAKHKGTDGGLYFGPKLTQLSDAAAEAIGSYQGRIWFAGLTTLSVGVAKALAKTGQHLFLLGLKELSPEIAQALARHRNDLSLNDLEHLSENAAAALATFEGDLYLDGLKELKESAASAIAGHCGELSLGGLRELSDAAALSLAKHQGLVFIYPDTKISAVAANAVAMRNFHALQQAGRLGEMLKPVENSRERRVALAELDAIITSSKNPGFWSSFRSKLRDGDEIWQYCSDRDSWDHLAGRAGYQITRDGKIIEGILTIMN